MKPGLQILNEFALKKLKEKHPSVPEHALPRPKYKDTSANALTRCIVDFINMSGHQAERINSMGRQIDQRKTVQDVLGNTRTIGSIKWVKGSGQKGTADISATINGRSVKVEVKVGKDQQSEEQKEYQERIEAAGGIYFIARDFESFYNWFNTTFEEYGK